MTEEKTYEACVSQKQADMFHHAAHDAEYAASRNLTTELAQGKLMATAMAGRFGKDLDGQPCPKCNPKCPHDGEISEQGHCVHCGAFVETDAVVEGVGPEDPERGRRPPPADDEPERELF